MPKPHSSGDLINIRSFCFQATSRPSNTPKKTRIMAQGQSLLDLPESVLLRALRFLAADGYLSGYPSLVSAARANSTLHKLSAAALTSITTLADQQQLGSLLLYLGRHSQHIGSLD